MTTTQMIPRHTVTTILANVDQARQEVLDAFKLLESAKTRLGATMGTDGYSFYSHLWERDISDSHLMQHAQKADTFIACNTWRYLLAQTGMLNYMTEKRQKELRDQLDKGAFPALTVANVFSTMEGLTQQVGTLLLESVKEVFDWLRPQHSRLKTNQKWQVGAKVILSFMVEKSYRGADYHINYRQSDRIRCLGKTFALLDGQGVPAYPHDTCTQLNEAFKMPTDGWYTLPYFQAKPYGNGNLHLTFTRMDLLQKLNQLGSDASLGMGTD